MFIVAVIVVVPCDSVFAGKIDGISLDAQGTVNAFNSMNDGNGFLFTTKEKPIGGAPYHLTDRGGTLDGAHCCTIGPDSPSMSAYVNGSIDSFTPRYSSSFPVDWKGTLNYTNGTTQTVNAGYNSTSMSVGTAYLYKLFATGELDLSESPYSSANLSNTLFNLSSFLKPSNPFGNILLEMNSDKNYWLSAYDPDAYYDEIGYYSVFYINAETDGDCYNYADTNFIYIAKVGDDPQVTPEPATMMLLGTGLLALPFARRFRKNLQNQQKK